jgi:hypothetical protein
VLVGSEARLYVTGYLIAHRVEPHVQWLTREHRFKRDVDLAEHLKTGNNTLILRVHDGRRNGGMFRRPFLSEPAAAPWTCRGRDSSARRYREESDAGSILSPSRERSRVS